MIEEINVKITEEMLRELRGRVTENMSQKRATHTLEIEKMAAKLCALFCPEKTDKMRAAALLHDITKEYSLDEHLMVCEKYRLDVSERDLFSPKTFHARTAAAIIPDTYPEFADGEIISAVRYHTTGREGMTLTEKIIYLADYIDMSRTFEDCVRLREYFFDAEPEKMGREELLRHLDSTLILSYDMTVSGLMFDGLPISEETFRSRNELVLGMMKK